MSDPIRNECVTAAVDELERHGLKGRVEHRRKHIAIVWSDEGGEKCFVTSATPGDRRAHLNAKSDIRRLIQVATAPEEEAFRPAIVISEGTPLTNSKHVAEAFEKQHGHVLRDIDNLLKNIDSPNLERLFRVIMAPDQVGIMRRSYDMTRDGFSLLAMGFSGAKALRFKLSFIEAFNVMERATIAVPESGEVMRLRADLEALTDLVFALPSPEPVRQRKPPFVRPSLLRRMRHQGLHA